MRCLEKSPAKRPGSAARAAEELAASHDRQWDVEEAREWWRVKGAAFQSGAPTLSSPGTMAVDLGRGRERAAMRA
jgi:hypothetical protein